MKMNVNEWVTQKAITKVLATKWGRSYNITLIGAISYSGSKNLTLQESEVDAGVIFELLKLILPKKTFKKLHMLIQQEVSRQIWVERKKKKYPSSKETKNA